MKFNQTLSGAMILAERSKSFNGEAGEVAITQAEVLTS